MTEAGKGAAPVRTGLPWPTVVTAFLLLVLFGWMTYQMFVVRIGESDAQWARSLAVYTTIESFALAAAGVLLGTQIQAGQVRAAEQRADAKANEAENERKRADKAEDDLGGYRVVTRALRKTLETGDGSAVAKDRGGASAGDPRVAAARSLLEQLP